MKFKRLSVILALFFMMAIMFSSTGLAAKACQGTCSGSKPCPGSNAVCEGCDCVPEFTPLAAGVVVMGLGAIAFHIRRKIH